METLISNNLFQMFVAILIIWGMLCIVALGLIDLRKDKEFVYDDLNKLLIRPTWYLRLFSMLMLYIVLPISIPYSLAHIIKKWF
jgi:hypothetical protein